MHQQTLAKLLKAESERHSLALEKIAEGSKPVDFQKEATYKAAQIMLAADAYPEIGAVLGHLCELSEILVSGEINFSKVGAIIADIRSDSLIVKMKIREQNRDEDLY